MNDRDVVVHPLAVYGLADFWPQLQRVRRETIIAVNVGGCLIPVGLVLYEIIQLAAFNPPALVAAAAGCVVNSLVCYIIARPVTGIGIVMPGVVSPIIAAGTALLLAPDAAAPVAFAIGVIGPLVAPISCISRISKPTKLASLVLEVQAPSMVSYCRALLRPIWHKSDFTAQRIY